MFFSRDSRKWHDVVVFPAITSLGPPRVREEAPSPVGASFLCRQQLDQPNRDGIYAEI